MKNWSNLTFFICEHKSSAFRKGIKEGSHLYPFEPDVLLYHFFINIICFSERRHNDSFLVFTPSSDVLN